MNAFENLSFLGVIPIEGNGFVYGMRKLVVCLILNNSSEQMYTMLQ